METWIDYVADIASAGQAAVAPYMGQISKEALILVAGLAGIVLGYPLLRRLLGRNRGERPSIPLRHWTRWPRRIGWATLLLFGGGFGVWATVAPLSSAALAPGVVSPDGNRKTVQHLEGGIIRTIHVTEGERVEAGAPLVTLEDVRALAGFEELRERLTFLLATEARLVAEARGAMRVNWPDDLLDERDGRAAQAVASQESLFSNRRETQMARERILSSRIDQLREEIAGIEEVISVQDEQLALKEEQVRWTEDLYERDLERLPPLLELKGEFAGLKAERASNRSAIARLKQQIGETELQLHATRQQLREQVSEELTTVRADLASIRSQLPERADALARTEITAPITGRVMNVQITTERGGVVRPGEPILEIVPENAPLVIDARLNPVDIEVVEPGQTARVLLTAYGQRNLPQIFGTLRSVSADRLVDENTGEAYFLAKVEVDPGRLDALGDGIELSPGMPADVMILTGEHTMADYLLRPFVESLTKSFRES